MPTIHTNTKIHKMSRDNVLAAHAQSGDVVLFETLDCYVDTLKFSEEDEQ